MNRVSLRCLLASAILSLHCTQDPTDSNSGGKVPVHPAGQAQGEPSSEGTRERLSPECLSDADCVPATCCHSSWCLPKQSAPVCEGDAPGCQNEPYPGSLDGGGGCLCVEGRCGALLNDGCVVVGPQPPVFSLNQAGYRYRRSCTNPRVPPGIDWERAVGGPPGTFAPRG